MGIILAFAPFLAFAVIDRLFGSVEGLLAGALVSAVFLLRDWFAKNQTPKILEIGTFILFAGLALYALLGNPQWSIFKVRLLVDGGLLLIVLATLVLRQPFTLQYAREGVPKEFWDRPEFLRTNDVITAVWALAFAAMVFADLILLYVPQWPPKVGILITIAALVAAVKFTKWYPARAASGSPG
ncbi:hypothetical protein [Aestuariivirga sp.]|uniref:hypothetical protein n=1 Tax=Aestuariivirga sp. TaxID=2650926 RepID=UPI0039E36260